MSIDIVIYVIGMTIVNEPLSSTPNALIYVGESMCERGNPRMSDMTIVLRIRLLHSSQNLYTFYVGEVWSS